MTFLTFEVCLQTLVALQSSDCLYFLYSDAAVIDNNSLGSKNLSSTTTASSIESAYAPVTPSPSVDTSNRGNDDEEEGFLGSNGNPLEGIRRMIEKELREESRSIMKGFHSMGSRIDQDFQESGEADMRRIQNLLKQHTKELRNMLRSVSQELTMQFRTMLRESRGSTNDTSIYESDMDIMEAFPQTIFSDEMFEMRGDKSKTFTEEKLRGNKRTREDESRNGFLSDLWHFMGMGLP